MQLLTVIASLAAICVLTPTQGVAQVVHFEENVTASNATFSDDLSNVSSTAGSALIIRNNSSSPLNFTFVWNYSSPAPVYSYRAFTPLASAARSGEELAIMVW